MFMLRKEWHSRGNEWRFLRLCDKLLSFWQRLRSFTVLLPALLSTSIPANQYWQVSELRFCVIMLWKCEKDSEICMYFQYGSWSTHLHQEPSTALNVPSDCFYWTFQGSCWCFYRTLLSCSSRIVFAQMCILLYYWANKMMMMMMMISLFVQCMSLCLGTLKFTIIRLVMESRYDANICKFRPIYCPYHLNFLTAREMQTVWFSTPNECHSSSS